MILHPPAGRNARPTKIINKPGQRGNLFLCFFDIGQITHHTGMNQIQAGYARIDKKYFFVQLIFPAATGSSSVQRIANTLENYFEQLSIHSHDPLMKGHIRSL